MPEAPQNQPQIPGVPGGGGGSGNLADLLRQLFNATARPNAPAAAPAAPARAPVVTPGAASAPAPQQQTQEPSLLDTLREKVRESVSPEASVRDSLAAFAAGMSSPRRRGFVQDLAAGLAAQSQHDAGRRNELRQAASTESDAEYKRAQVELERRKQEWERDPNNPHTIERLAHARALLAQAARAGNETRDRVNSTQRDAEGNLYLIHESGRVTRAGGEGGPSFVDPDRSPEARRWLNWSTNREALERGLRTAPMSLTETPDQRSARIRRELEDYDRANPRPRAPFDPRPDPNAAPAAERPAPDENQRVIRGNL